MPRSTEIDVEVAAALAQGARARQEDALATAFPQGAELGFAVLSDGMGGHAAGDVASRIIVSEIFAELTLRSVHPDFETSDIPRLLEHAVRVANECLRAHVEDAPEMHGMGGTVIATMMAGNRLFWASVGDSPLYLYRKGALSRLNADHSMAPQIDLLAEQGVIDAATARDHPQRNCLTSALVGEEIPEIDCPEAGVELLPGDLVLAASDGLQYLPDAGIATILKRARRKASAGIAEALIAGVSGLNDPEQDNISVVVLKAAAKRAPRAGLSPLALFAGLTGGLAPVSQLTARDG